MWRPSIRTILFLAPIWGFAVVWLGLNTHNWIALFHQRNCSFSGVTKVEMARFNKMALTKNIRLTDVYLKQLHDSMMKATEHVTWNHRLAAASEIARANGYTYSLVFADHEPAKPAYKVYQLATQTIHFHYVKWSNLGLALGCLFGCEKVIAFRRSAPDRPEFWNITHSYAVDFASRPRPARAASWFACPLPDPAL
jgi:hypothetical protein